MFLTLLKKYSFTLCFVFLTALASIPAYYRMFTGFSFWDDEGALMVTVKQYLSGMKLYNQISVPYGPVYYFYNWTLRTLSATPVTHDIVRMSSLLPMLLTMFVCAWVVFRFSGSLALASATHVWVFFTLYFFRQEPGHPQELCVLLLVCLVAAGILASIPRWRLLGMILLGALPAALALIKVNIGTFACLATSLAVLAHSPKTKLSRFAFAAIGVACILLPVILMKAHLGDPRTRFFAVLIVVSMIAILVVLFVAPRTFRLPFRDSLITIAAFVSTFAAVIVILKVQGVALTRVLHSLLLDSLGPYVLHGSFYAPLPIISGRRWYLWTLGVVAVTGYFSWSAWKKNLQDRYLPIAKLALAFLVAADLFFSTPLFSFVPQFPLFVLPFCWLVLYGCSANDRASDAFLRTLLCVLTVLQTLYTYPVAGSQFSFVKVLPIIVIMICLGDFWAWQRQRLPSLSRTILGASTILFFLGVAASYVATAYSERRDYYSMPSLQLPGSGRIHLPDMQAQDYRWLVKQLDDYCEVFVGLPEVPSLHIWTGKDALVGIDMDDWMIAISNEQQLAAAKVLSEHANACAIYNPDLVNFWDRPHHDLDSLSLVRYLHENFKVAGRTGQFSLLVRNERNLVVESRP